MYIEPSDPFNATYVEDTGFFGPQPSSSAAMVSPLCLDKDPLLAGAAGSAPSLMTALQALPVALYTLYMGFSIFWLASIVGFSLVGLVLWAFTTVAVAEEDITPGEQEEGEEEEMQEDTWQLTAASIGKDAMGQMSYAAAAVLLLVLGVKAAQTVSSGSSSSSSCSLSSTAMASIVLACLACWGIDRLVRSLCADNAMILGAPATRDEDSS